MKLCMIAMSIQDEAKALYAYDYVSLKTEERNRKNIKKRHLGDLKGRHASRKATPQLVGSLMNLYLPEARAINRTTADRIITDQSHRIRRTFNKQHREAILDKWARPSSPEDNPRKQFDGRLDKTEKRPQTAPGYHGLLHVPFQPGPAPRPHSSGSFKTPPCKPPHPSGFMWVRMKQNSSEDRGLSTITDEIREYWENEDRRDREKRNRLKKQRESFSGGLLSFAGSETDSVSLIDTFTGDAPTSSDQYYSIDAKVGSLVARHLQSGNKLHIGRNGNLQSDTLRIRSSEELAETSDSSDTLLKSSTLGMEKPVHLIPLDWSEQVLKPDVRVVEVSEKAAPTPKKVPFERHPVVYSKLIQTNERPKIHIKLDKYCIRHRSKPKLNVDGTESLSQRITTITVDDLSREDTDAMTMEDYQILLEQKLEGEESHHDTIQSLTPKAPEVAAVEGTPVISLEQKGDVPHAPRQRLTPQAPEVYVKESTSLAGLDQMSDISSLTIDEPPSLGCSERSSYSKREQALSPLPPCASILSQRSVPTMPTRSTAAKSWTTNPALRPRSEMVRRREPSAVSRRVKSGISRRYVFDQPPTPRSIQSPRPKPGQMFRSGVSSINSGRLEGEQEYIKISHQIPSGHHGASSEADVSINRSNSSRIRVDNHQDCSCTEEARRALASALSGHSMFIDIPHGTDKSGITPQVSFKTSSDTGGDDESSQYSEKDDLSDLDDFLDSPVDGDHPVDDGGPGNDKSDCKESLDPLLHQNPQSQIITKPDGSPRMRRDNLSGCEESFDPSADGISRSKDVNPSVRGGGTEGGKLSGCEDSVNLLKHDSLEDMDLTPPDRSDCSEESNLSGSEKVVSRVVDENLQPDDQNHAEEDALSACKDPRNSPEGVTRQSVDIPTPR